MQQNVVNKSLFFNKFLMYKHIQASNLKHTGGLTILKASSFFSWGQLGNVRFRLFWFQERSEAWVKCVYSDTDSETWQLWLAFGKGKSFLSSSRCGAKVHGFALIASTWLHNSKCEKWEDGGVAKDWMKGKKGGRWNKLDDVIWLTEDPVSSNNIQTLHLLSLKMPKGWATATKIKMAN